MIQGFETVAQYDVAAAEAMSEFVEDHNDFLCVESRSFAGAWIGYPAIPKRLIVMQAIYKADDGLKTMLGTFDGFDRRSAEEFSEAYKFLHAAFMAPPDGLSEILTQAYIKNAAVVLAKGEERLQTDSKRLLGGFVICQSIEEPSQFTATRMAYAPWLEDVRMDMRQEVIDADLNETELTPEQEAIADELETLSDEEIESIENTLDQVKTLDPELLKRIMSILTLVLPSEEAMQQMLNQRLQGVWTEGQPAQIRIN